MAHTSFNKLSTEIRQRLIKRIETRSDGLVFKTASLSGKWLRIVIAVVWFAVLFYVSDNYLWPTALTVIFFLVSTIAAYVLASSLFFVVRWITSPAKFNLLVSPCYVIDTRFDDIYYWNLDQLLAVDLKHNHRSGNHTTSQISLKLSDGNEKVVTLKDRETAENAYDDITHFRKLFIEATHKNDSEYLLRDDDFRDIDPATVRLVGGKSRGILTQFTILAVAGVLSAGAMYAAISLNNYFDDLRSWNDAKSIARASGFRNYLSSHPKGRWLADASSELQRIYDEAEKKYRASLQTGYDEQAVAAVSRILQYAKTTLNHKVMISYDRHNKLPEDIEERVKRESGVKHVLPLGDSFSVEKMTGREGVIFTVVSQAFANVIPDDVLEISTRCDGPCARLSVEYTVASEYDGYFDDRQKDTPEDARFYSPGIFVDWVCNVTVPDEPQSYSFSLSSYPAEHVTYSSNSSDEPAAADLEAALRADSSLFNDAMAESAFQDFKINLMQRFGIIAKGVNDAPMRQDTDGQNNSSQINRK